MSKKWWKAAGIRAVKTAAQAAIGAIGSAVVFAEINPVVVVSTAGVAAVLSLLTSVAGLPEVDE